MKNYILARKIYYLFLICVLTCGLCACGASGKKLKKSQVQLYGEKELTKSDDPNAGKKKFENHSQDDMQYSRDPKDFLKNKRSKLKVLLGFDYAMSRYIKGMYKYITFFDYRNLVDETSSVEYAPRYKDITSDGKLRWDVGRDMDYGRAWNLEQHFNQFTIGDELISLPTNLSSLSPEFKIFEDIDFDKLTEEEMPFVAEAPNISLRLELYLSDGEPSTKFLHANIFSGDKLLVSCIIEPSRAENNVIGLYSLSLDSIGLLKLNIGEIGVGNTFNEAYDVFGKPSKIKNSEYGKSIIYEYYEVNSKLYCSITFYHDYELKLSEDITLKLMPNVITHMMVIRSDGDNRRIQTDIDEDIELTTGEEHSI